MRFALAFAIAALPGTSVLAQSSSAAVGPFDGSVPMICALREVLECVPGADCQRLRPGDASAPDFFVIDIAARMVKGLGASPRTSAIKSVANVEGNLVLQGSEESIADVREGIGWSATIAPVGGDMVLTASGASGAFVVFGVCAALLNENVPSKQ